MSPIKNGADSLLSEQVGTLPNVQGAMLNWFQPMIFTRVEKLVENFQLVETTKQYTFQGVKQPFSAQQLQLKPEGQRNWKWFTIHAFPDLILVPDEIIRFGESDYRVMMKYDFSEYGYLKYDIVQDFNR